VGFGLLAEPYSRAALIRPCVDTKRYRKGRTGAIADPWQREGNALNMESIKDFEDILELLGKHKVRYLIIGGLAFIYHAKPRYTKDMDLWIDPAPENIKQANRALAEFGSPYTLTFENVNEILQLGVAPDRIDLIMNVTGATFETAWRNRIRGRYGEAKANWIDLDSLIRIKSRINNPRHQEDVRVLREVRKRRARSTKAKKK